MHQEYNIPPEQELRKLLEATGPVKKTGVHLYGTCPVCGAELKFYLNVKTGLNDCKKGCQPGNIFTFLRAVDALHLLQGKPIDVAAQLTNNLFPEEEAKKFPPLPPSKLPAGFKRLQYDDQNIFAAYLRERKYTQEDFLVYQPGYTTLIERLENYVIIPVYQNWEVKGYLARSIIEGYEPRYQNKKGIAFANLLDGIDECTVNTTTAIIVEGHFDKVSVTTELDLQQQEEVKAISSYGKKLTAAQLFALSNTGIKNLIFMYDMSDAINQIKAYGNKLKRQFNVLGCFKHTGLDAGKMQAPQLLEMLASAEPIENFTYNHVQFNALR
jgi:hypothetical protein